MTNDSHDAALVTNGGSPLHDRNDTEKRLAHQVDAEFRSTHLAHAALRPTTQAAITVEQCNKDLLGDTSLNVLIADLDEQCKRVSKGDVHRTEAMLIAQAHTLDTVFNDLARRAALNMSERVGHAETYMRLALKAQAQCRATLTALIEIRCPRTVAFVGQANVAHGPQQVNNDGTGFKFATVTDLPTRARESESAQDELLEGYSGKWLDTAETAAAGRADSRVEALGPIHRTEDGPR